MKLEFAATITAADTESRKISGQIVPWGKPGNTSAGLVEFAVGSIKNLDPAGVKLLFQHQADLPVGWAVALKPTPGGVHGEFELSKSSRGTDVLIEAKEGIRTGFSVGVEVESYTYRDEVMVISAATLQEVSVVTAPAFGLEHAAISEIAASAPAETEVQNTQQMETETVENLEAPAVEAAQDIEAATPKTAPIFTAPRVAPITSGQYLEATVRAALGDRDAQVIVRAADDSTSTNTGLTLAPHMSGFLTENFGNRPVIDACGGTMALPSSGLSFTIPSMIGGTAPTVTAPGEAQAVSETGMTSSYQTVSVSAYKGMNTVSLELLERSQPNFGDLLVRELQKAYAKATDTAVIAALTANGTQATGVAGSLAGLQSFIATEAPAAYIGTGGDVASELVTSSAWWTELLAANDSSDRPLFTALQPSNAAGNVNARQANGQVFGTNFWVDHNIATDGLIDESAFLIAPDSVGLWEGGNTQLRVNVLGTGQVEIMLYGYFAAKVLKPKGVRRFNLTA